MPGTSKQSVMVAFRLDNATYHKIKETLKHPANNATSVSDYCKQAVIRHVWRKH